MRTKEIIELTDTPLSAMVKMSKGNPGAASALVAIFKAVPIVDPDAAFGGLGAILLLDSYGIYGTDIYILWSDICERNTTKTIAVLRAVQLGFFSSAVLVDAAHRQDRTGKALVPVEELYLKVKERLPNFDSATEIAKGE